MSVAVFAHKTTETTDRVESLDEGQFQEAWAAWLTWAICRSARAEAMPRDGSHFRERET